MAIDSINVNVLKDLLGLFFLTFSRLNFEHRWRALDALGDVGS